MVGEIGIIKCMLETIVYLRKLIGMVSIMRKLSLFLLAQLVFMAHVAEASDFGIVTNGQVPVYKFIDSKGNITYSESGSANFVQIEKIAISAPPSQQQLEESKQRLVEMKMAVDEFNDARVERDAIREQNTLKRLQRLALINQAKPPVVTREFIYPAYPYRFKRKHGHSGHHGRPAYHPSNHSQRRNLSLPSSSFPGTFH